MASMASTDSWIGSGQGGEGVRDAAHEGADWAQDS
jgi:hypothetical protein